MFKLIYQEIILQNKIHHLAKHFFFFLLFASVCTVIIAPNDNISEFGLMISIIFIPLFLLCNNYFLIKYEIHNGDLEMLLTTFSAQKIINAKFSSLCFNLLMSFLLIMPLMAIFFSLPLFLGVKFFMVAMLVLLLSCALTILIASIQSYFQANYNFLSVMIMPLLLPNIILAGMVIQTPEKIVLILMMLGVDLIIIPISLFASGFLIKNIYNI